MPYEITLDQLPGGYALTDAKEGEVVRVSMREFTSSEDGERFIARLDGLPTRLVSHLQRLGNVRASEIDHLVAVIRPDRTATVYVNELPIVAHVRATRPIGPNEEVTENDIGDMQSVDLGVELPATAGILVIMSAKWRKGLFFDLGPLNGQGDRAYDINELLSSYFAYLHNQAIFSLSEEDWSFLVDQLWFPFVGLPKKLLRTLLDRARRRADLDTLVPQIRDSVRDRLDVWVHAWSAKAQFSAHVDLLNHAAHRYREGDFMSATAILYPRIEGLLRDVRMSESPGAKLTQGVLAATVADLSRELRPHSWLLPERFKRYLKQVYFASFEPGKPAKLSRNAVGHGVASASDFSEKAAAIGFLVIEQIHWFIPSKKPNTA